MGDFVTFPVSECLRGWCTSEGHCEEEGYQRSLGVTYSLAGYYVYHKASVDIEMYERSLGLYSVAGRTRNQTF